MLTFSVVLVVRVHFLNLLAFIRDSSFRLVHRVPYSNV